MEAPLATRFTLLSCLAYSSTLQMEAVCSSETSVDFQRTTRRYIPEDRTLHPYTALPPSLPTAIGFHSLIFQNGRTYRFPFLLLLCLLPSFSCTNQYNSFFRNLPTFGMETPLQRHIF
jgi:hypothetical protein